MKGNCEEIEFRAKKVTDESGDCIELDFLLLNSGDGALIEVLHANEASIGNPKYLIAGVKNIGRIKEFNPPEKTSWLAQFKDIRPIYFLLVLIGFTVWVMTTTKAWDSSWWFFISAWVIAALFTLYSYFQFQRFPSWTRGESSLLHKDTKL